MQTLLEETGTINPALRRDLGVLTTQSNSFGVFRRYHAEAYPSHDPEADLDPLLELSDIAIPAAPKSERIPATLFRPYPNRNAFLLGEWYWNGGTQKTKESFKDLISIIGDRSYDPADVADVPWDSLNECLGESTTYDDTWIDEPDATWTQTSITLTIPFQINTPNPGLQQYTFPPFRHRNIVAVLKEKMANAHDFRLFHLEPYELLWRRKDMPKDQYTRVHGELYSSPAFLEAHKEIQTARGSDPGCTLPRVVAGLMFGSDGTQLTSFGGAALWPCYMYFGNESKYRRCKPTHNLCNHIAYFQKV